MFSDKTWWDRWMPASGLLFVVLFAVGFLVIGDPPAIEEPAESYAGFFEENRGRTIAGSILVGLSLYWFVWFTAALSARIADEGEQRLRSCVTAAGAAFAATMLVFIGIVVAIAHTVAPESSPEITKALAVVSRGIRILGFFALAALIFAFGVAVSRTAVVAPWFARTSLGAALVAFLGGTTWANEGFWAPYGGFTTVATIICLLWVLAASILLVSAPASRSGRGPA